MFPLSEPEEKAMWAATVEEKWKLICNQVGLHMVLSMNSKEEPSSVPVVPTVQNGRHWVLQCSPESPTGRNTNAPNVSLCFSQSVFLSLSSLVYLAHALYVRVSSSLILSRTE